MAHREQILAILDDARLPYEWAQGNVVCQGCVFQFQVNGDLREMKTEDEGDEDAY